ncbi:hypothetical protein [Acidihalobacter ferrooxydans]|uniref:3-deoxy-D-manno-octulosonic acid transferase n=1 Tax=Acidihalobacter ferrooxydans TaxID=1765967 RepID=A0A1P8UEC0_9GAMM|nr:hypothetical protein [Acidihalobacter ferrooxydans]APZ42181.1 hypothetical protein BW247_02965 [Acidihalobacter ferrooxydans]
MLPDYTPDTRLCERFQEFHDRNQWVFYVPYTGSAEEEARAYGLLFEVLRKKTAIMMITPADPERYVPVYQDALKYRLPTIRHSRLYTSKVPKNNRVYFIEEVEPVRDFYACAGMVIPGGTLSADSTTTPDLVTPILAGKPVLVGPHREDPVVQEAVAADVVRMADDVEGLAEVTRALFADPDAVVEQVAAARAWLEQRG